MKSVPFLHQLKLRYSLDQLAWEAWGEVGKGRWEKLFLVEDILTLKNALTESLIKAKR